MSTAPSKQTKADTSRVKILTEKDVPKASRTLVKSFEEDSLAKLLTDHIDDLELKNQVEHTLYECYLKQHLEKGICLGIGEGTEEYETVAIWSTPTSIVDGLDSFDNLMYAGYGKLWEQVGEEGREKIFRGMLPLLHDTAERILSTDSRFKGKGVYTLVYLGSVASARGKGNVRAMFDYMFHNYIDKPGTNNIAYLESSSSDNIPIYNRFGFVFYEDIMLGSNEDADAKEGEDYAIMNVMIRGSFGKDWSKDLNSEAKL